MSEDRVHLRPITAEDTDRIVTWRNQDFVRKNFIYQKPFTREGHEAWLREKVEPGHVAQFIICLSDGREIGSVYLRDIDREAETAEYGIFIGEKDAIGRGLGSQAAALALDYAFETLRLARVYLRLLEDNIIALKNYEKVGFRLLKDRRETAVLEQGVRGVIFMEIDRGEWERRKEQNG